jgi:hypothetical protein
MPALKDTLERVATFATILSTDGISIRLLNYNKDGDGDFDHLKTVKSVAQKLEKIQCSGDTRLGTILEKKIVKPMILEKATAGTLKKPIIIVIITDGEVSSPGPWRRTREVSSYFSEGKYLLYAWCITALRRGRREIAGYYSRLQEIYGASRL